MSKFDLKELMAEGKVSKLDTGNAGREQIEYIDIDRIDDDPNNFYELSSLDELAANIELFGLQQPIRVRPNPEDASRVIIVSGHRRRAAVRQLLEGGRADLREIPCIRERAEGSAALQELRLIYANSDTRRLTSAEISKQAERVEALLYQLKEEGYEFPGRMRDHVAEACKVSTTKLARLKVIRDNLNEIWVPSYEAGDLGESTAYALARMDAMKQRRIYLDREKREKPPKQLYEGMVETYAKRFESVDKLVCPISGEECTNCGAKYDKAMALDSWTNFPCGGCCDKCFDLARCKYACPRLAEKVKKLKADAKAQKQQEARAKEEEERPIISEIMKLWDRYGQARATADKSVKECYNTVGVRYGVPTEDEVMALECLEAKFRADTKLPYGYNCYLDDVKKFVNIADLLGVSLDYLLCRTDNPKGFAATVEPPAEGWIPLKFVDGHEIPPRDGLYYCRFDCEGKILKQVAWWDEYLKKWKFKKYGTDIDAKCVSWFPLPAEEEVPDADT